MKSKIKNFIIVIAFVFLSIFSAANTSDTNYFNNCIIGNCINETNEGNKFVSAKLGNENFEYLNNSIHYSILSGGGGADSVWQMKTYYEMITLNANQLRMLENDLEEMRIRLEQIKRMPEELIIQEISKHTSMVAEMIEIQNTAKDILKDARAFETYYSDLYKDIKNGDYVALLDRYASTINDLTYNAMRTSNMGNKASKNAGENAKYLMQQTRTAQNPTQLLEVLSKWNSNLSYQINAISDMMNSSNRLQILEAQQKASEIQVSRQQQENALKILQERKKQIEKRLKK